MNELQKRIKDLPKKYEVEVTLPNEEKELRLYNTDCDNDYGIYFQLLYEQDNNEIIEFKVINN